jgi:hypothetical protein
MMSHWVPFTLSWDDHLPVDISFVFDEEKPAGKHGFLTVKGNLFVFEDGTVGRFWGTNFNSGANFPPHDYSEMVARRLAKLGVNIIRFHQMDAEWATPNIFELNRAIPKNNTLSFEAECIDRLDYLIHCLKEQGIYVYMDMLTYRQFRVDDEVDAYEKLPQAAKPYLYFDQRLIALQKDYNQQLWSHKNPYTRMAYKDDPAIVMTELVNEADFFTHPVNIEPYRSRFETTYRAWAEDKGIWLNPGPVDFTHPNKVMSLFFVQVMMNYNREMVQHLRSLGVKIPITGTNWTTYLGVTAAQSEMDFCDSHVYWNYPWTGPAGTVTSRPMVAELRNDYAVLAMMRLEGKPFFVSEWDHAYPAIYRAESVLPLAAVSVFQNWGGSTIHTYRYGTWIPENRLAGGSSTINGVVYRNFFDTFNDPAKFGLFYHAALIVRRGDVQPAANQIAIQVPETENWMTMTASGLPGLAGLPEVSQVGMVLPGRKAQSDHVVSAVEQHINEQSGEIISDTGELRRSWKERFGVIDSPRTQAVYGFLGEAGLIKMSSLEVAVTNDFGVIALSSLTDDPIENSHSMLLTAIGRCENSGAQYNEGKSRLLSAGTHPMLIEAIEAQIRIKTNLPHPKILVISEQGELVRQLENKVEHGVLSFTIGPQPEWNPSTMYYLIRG